MIKPSLWEDDKINKISLQSVLLFIGLWNFADDYGVLINSNRRILGDIFPLRNDVSVKEIENWKNELIKQNLIITIQNNGISYLCIKGWEKHQKVPNRSERKYLQDLSNKEFQKLINKSNNPNETLIRPSLDTNETLMRPSLPKEKEKEKVKDQSSSQDVRSNIKDILLEEGIGYQDIEKILGLGQTDDDFLLIQEKNDEIMKIIEDGNGKIKYPERYLVSSLMNLNFNKNTKLNKLQKRIDSLEIKKAKELEKKKGSNFKNRKRS